MAPVGQFSRQPALEQCLHTSDMRSHEKSPTPVVWPPSGIGRSTNETCRHVEAPRSTVLSYDMPVKANPSSGSWFHSLHATSHALQPMQTVVSVKNPFAPMSGLFPFLRSDRLDAVGAFRT